MQSTVTHLLLVLPYPDGGRPGDDHLGLPLSLVLGEVEAHLSVAGRHLTNSQVVKCVTKNKKMKFVFRAHFRFMIFEKTLKLVKIQSKHSNELFCDTIFTTIMGKR